MNSRDISIRKISSDDINDIVEIHMCSFEGFFLSNLGRRFLKVYYESVLLLNESVALCAILDNEIIGFASGTVESNGYNKRLLRKKIFSYTGEFLRLAILKPKAIIHLFKNINKGEDWKEVGAYGELFSIATKPAVEGKGVGSILLAEFENVVVRQGNIGISLTTDFYNNDNVLGFYRKNGYNILNDFETYPNRRMYKLLKVLNSNSLNDTNNEKYHY